MAKAVLGLPARIPAHVTPVCRGCPLGCVGPKLFPFADLFLDHSHLPYYPSSWRAKQADPRVSSSALTSRFASSALQPSSCLLQAEFVLLKHGWPELSLAFPEGDPLAS